MAWPSWSVGKKLTGAMWADVKGYVDQIDLETFARFSASGSLSSGVLVDLALSASPAPGIANDPLYSLSTGQLVIGAPGVYIANVYGVFNSTVSRKSMELISTGGVDTEGKIAYAGTEDRFNGAVLMTVATTGSLKLQVLQDTSATAFSGRVRIQRLARLT